MLRFVKMPNVQMLRALVNERLTAAAEEIFALFERTIAEYEGELCRFQKENQRQRRLLDEVTPRGPLPCAGAGVRVPSPSPGPGLDQETKQTVEIKEEQSVKQEEEQLPVSVPEFIAVCVKTEESPLLQSESENREETQDVSPEPHFHTETRGHTEFSSGTNYDREPPFSCPASLMETEADGDHYNQVQFRDRRVGQNSLQPGTSSTGIDGDVSATDEGDKNKIHQCPVCKNKFWSKFSLQKHFKVHTEDRPFCCSICPKTFIHKGDLDKHHRIHTGEKPYCCAFCEKTFTQKGNLDKHTRVHTGERPYSCLLCDKTFSVACTLQAHMRTHTGEKPYSCSLCNKGFSQGSALRAHMSTHTGDKPFSCSICNKGFKQRSYLRVHMRNHTDKPELNQSTDS